MPDFSDYQDYSASRPSNAIAKLFGDSPLAQILGAILQQQVVQATGTAPIGIGGGNPLQRYDQWQLSQEQLQLYNNMARRDANTALSQTRKIGETMGHRWTADDQRAVAAIANSGATAIGTQVVAGLSPTMFDQALSPWGGSSLVMSQHMLPTLSRMRDANGNRLTQDQTRDLLEQVYQQGFQTESDKAGQHRGLSAGQAGQVFEHLSRGGGIGARNIDPKKINDKIKEYTGIVKTMQEVFGEAGYDNVPINQLLKQFEAMSGGLANGVGRPKAEAMLRHTVAMFQENGMGLEGMNFMAGQAAQLAQAMGLDPATRFGLMNSAAAAYSGYGQMGFKDTAMWGAPNRDKFTRSTMMAAAAWQHSAVGSEVAVAGRLRSMLGKDFNPNSALGRWLAAAEAGNVQRLELGKFKELAAQSTGLDVSVVSQMLHQTHMNEEYLQTPEAALAGRAAQRSDLVARMTRQAARAFGNVDQRHAGRLGRAAVNATIKALEEDPSMSAEKRRQFVGEAMYEDLRAHGYNVGRFGGHDRAVQRLGMLAEVGIGNADQQLVNAHGAHGGAASALMAASGRYVSATDQTRQIAARNAEQARQAQDMRVGSVAQGAARAVSNLSPWDSLRDMATKFVKGVFNLQDKGKTDKLYDPTQLGPTGQPAAGGPKSPDADKQASVSYHIGRLVVSSDGSAILSV